MEWRRLNLSKMPSFEAFLADAAIKLPPELIQRLKHVRETE